MITPLSPALQSQPYKMPGGIVGISGDIPCLISCECPFVLLRYLTAPHSKNLLNLGWNFISALWSYALGLKTKTCNCQEEETNRNKEQPITKVVTVSLDYLAMWISQGTKPSLVQMVSLPCWDFSFRNELWDCGKASSCQIPSPTSGYSPWQAWTGPFFPKQAWKGGHKQAPEPSVNPLYIWQ